MAHVIQNSLVRECSSLACCPLCHFVDSLWVSVSFDFRYMKRRFGLGSPFLWQICLQWLERRATSVYLSWPWVSCTTSQDLAKLNPGMSNLHTNKFSVMTESGLELKSPLHHHILDGYLIAPDVKYTSLPHFLTVHNYGGECLSSAYLLWHFFLRQPGYGFRILSPKATF